MEKGQLIFNLKNIETYDPADLMVCVPPHSVRLDGDIQGARCFRPKCAVV